MPGLMAMRSEYAASQPLAGARITGSLHMTVQTAVLIETLTALGAGCAGPAATSSRPRTTPPPPWPSARRHGRRPQGRAGLRLEGRDARGVLVVHRAGPAVARRGRPEHDPRRRWRRHPARPQGRRVREGGRGARPLHRRLRGVPVVLALLGRSLAEDPSAGPPSPTASRASPRRPPPACTASTRWPSAGELLFPAINVNDSVTKSKFDNKYGCRHSLIDGINRATDVLIGGKVAVVCGYGDVGKGCAQSLSRPGRPRRGHRGRPHLRAAGGHGGLPGHHAGGHPRVLADIIITTTGNKDIITAEHMAGMKHQAIVGNIGHFDNEIDMAGPAKTPGSSGSTSSPRSTSGSSPTATRSSSCPRAGC
jgi:adenosylhomocysteinase